MEELRERTDNHGTMDLGVIDEGWAKYLVLNVHTTPTMAALKASPVGGLLYGKLLRRGNLLDV